MIPFKQSKVQTNIKLLQHQDAQAQRGGVEVENEFETSKNLKLLLENIYEENARVFFSKIQL